MTLFMREAAQHREKTLILLLTKTTDSTRGAFSSLAIAESSRSIRRRVCRLRIWPYASSFLC